MPRRFSFEDKLDRASEHLSAVNNELWTWLRDKPYQITHKFDLNWQKYTIRIRATGRPPSRLSVLIGDCLYNIRSALDHLALALTEANCGCLPLAAAKQTEFPIFSKAALYASNGVRAIRHMSPAAQAIIEGLQPYKAGEPKDWTAIHPLWLLHELSNIDKHRTLLVAFTAYKQSGFSRRVETDILWEFWHAGTPAPLEPDTDILIASYRATSADGRKRMKMKLYPLFDVVFADAPAQRYAVSETLGRIIKHVRNEVVDLLRPFL